MKIKYIKFISPFIQNTNTYPIIASKRLKDSTRLKQRYTIKLKYSISRRTSPQVELKPWDVQIHTKVSFRIHFCKTTFKIFDLVESKDDPEIYHLGNGDHACKTKLNSIEMRIRYIHLKQKRRILIKRRKYQYLVIELIMQQLSPEHN